MMIWERLEETYDSPEAIEHTLFSKLENFPKVSYKDPHKLRELAVLLIEVEAAKLDGILTGCHPTILVPRYLQRSLPDRGEALIQHTGKVEISGFKV